MAPAIAIITGRSSVQSLRSSLWRWAVCAPAARGSAAKTATATAVIVMSRVTSLLPSRRPSTLYNSKLEAGRIESACGTPMTTADHEYTDWLERYRRAWMQRDPNAAGQLFTDDAIYREQPFQPPFVGRAAIQDYWARVTASQTSVELRYGRTVVD